MDKKLIALTFDDGPSNVTSRFLDVIEKYNIPVTFFLIGQQVTPEKEPILRRQLALGCEIANHSFTHSDMSKMSNTVIKDEIVKTAEVIKSMVGVETNFFRPPFILLSDEMYDNIKLPFICGVDSVDWDPETTVQNRINNVISKASDGAIVLMHDLENNYKTLEALPIIIKKLKEQGYSFVTVSELFQQKNIDPNQAHKMWSNVFE